eukprot:jgi/Bigna1/81655/fgenesh1_pg.82_\
MEDMISTVDTFLSKPECFLNKSRERREILAGILKQLYAKLLVQAKSTGLSSEATRTAMSQLIVSQFDTEQIWEQLQILNKPMVTVLRKYVEGIVDRSRKEAEAGNDTSEGEEVFEGPTPKPKGWDSASAIDNEKKGGGDPPAKESKEGTKKKKKKAAKKEEEAVHSSLSTTKAGTTASAAVSDEERDLAERMKTTNEDLFYDEDELDEIADFDYRDGDYQVLERQQAEKDDNSEEEEEEDDDDVDFNAPIEDGEAVNLKYSDFFDSPDPAVFSSQSHLQKGDNKEEEGGDEVEEEEEDDDELHGEKSIDEGGENGGDDEEEDPQGLSRYEKQKRKMKEQIKMMEEKIVKPREWVLSGEVDAARRPENSLLETDLNFQMAQRLPEPITVEATQELEDLIKNRIINEVWDDVERKEPPKEKRYKPKKELSQEKSEVGLAELYDREYVAKATGTNFDDEKLKTELDEAHMEIAQLMSQLNHKLDALSNFHFTPKPHVEELRVATETPAISMEEVLPMAVSKEAASAPQEAYKSESQGMPTQRAEMSRKEKTTLRNTKKKRLRKRKRSKTQEDKKDAKTNQRKELEQNFKKAQDSNLLADAAEVDQTDYSKSAAFFAKIQEAESTTGGQQQQQQQRASYIRKGNRGGAKKKRKSAASLKI